MGATRCAAAAVALLVAAACSSSNPATAIRCPSPHPLTGGRAVSVDYVDIVVHDNISYLNTNLTEGHALEVAPADVGDVVFTVSCDFSAFTASGRVEPPTLMEGASGYLPTGTDVHAVRGFPIGCRLTARREGRWVAYLAQHEVNHMSATLPCALHARP